MHITALAASVAMLSGPQSERFEFTWTAPDGSERTHLAVVDEPAEHNGFAVMLFGGGSVTDEDWTVPGVVDNNGEPFQLTVDGEATRDAATIAAALTDAGFIVLRYDSIHRDDPLHARDPAMAEYMAYDQTLSLARRAWDVLPARVGLDRSRIFSIGHSLGATRALHATGGEAAGYITLAGAYLARTNERPSVLCAEALSEYGDVGSVTPIAWKDAGHPASRFHELDADGSGDLAGWELAGAALAAAAPEPEFRHAPESWAADVLARTDAPTLAIWGGADPISVNSQTFGEVRSVETCYFAGLDHNLSRGADGRVGPIDGAVVDAIVAWVSDQATIIRPTDN